MCYLALSSEGQGMVRPCRNFDDFLASQRLDTQRLESGHIETFLSLSSAYDIREIEFDIMSNLFIF